KKKKKKNSNRRLSVYNKASTITADPRPIKDKAFIKNSTKVVLDYLIAHNYDRTPISHALLDPPTSKLFVAVIEFLFQQIDPTFVMKKLEEDIPLYLARVRYPFRIPKGTLASPGSPHAWPSLLAALVWLVEMLKLAEAVDFDPAKENEDPNSNKAVKDEGADKDKEKDGEWKMSIDSDRAILEWFSNLYSSWLSGEEDSDSIDRIIQGRFQAKEEESRANIQAYAKANEQLKAEIQKLNTFSTVTELNAKKIELERERVSHREHLEAMQVYKAKLIEKQSSCSAMLQELRSKLDRDKKNLEELKHVLANQSTSPEELERMRQTEEMLRTATDKISWVGFFFFFFFFFVLLNKKKKKKKYVRKAIYTKGHELRDLYGKLNKRVEDYNAMIQRANGQYASNSKIKETDILIFGFKKKKKTIQYNKTQFAEEVLRNDKKELTNNLKLVAEWNARVKTLTEDNISVNNEQLLAIRAALEGLEEQVQKEKLDQKRCKERTEKEAHELEKLKKLMTELEDVSWKEVLNIEFTTLGNDNAKSATDIEDLERKIAERIREFCVTTEEKREKFYCPFAKRKQNIHYKRKEKIKQECERYSEEGMKIVLETIEAITTHQKCKREQILEIKRLSLQRRQETCCYEIKEPNDTFLFTIKKF
ncbi:hypothetical protein RFI_17170, partial [Reticulomyxa filosa]